MQTPRVYLFAGLIAIAGASPSIAAEDVGAGQEIYLCLPKNLIR